MGHNSADLTRLDWPALEPVYAGARLLILFGLSRFVQNQPEWSAAVFMVQHLSYQTYHMSKISSYQCKLNLAE